MRHVTRAAGMVALAALLVWNAAPTAQSRPEAALRSAIETETVKGDLKGAIQQYLALSSGPDRAIAAQALVRMAGCHRKLGDGAARALYERVLREFSDQAEAVAAARAELERGDTAGAPAVKGDRAVWTGDKVDMFGRVSPDGRRITYVDWVRGGNLAVRDLSTGTDHLLTSYPGDAYSEFAEYSAVSADGTEVAYVWGTNPSQRREIRRLRLDGAGSREPARIYAAGADVRFVGPLDWSSDKSRIATALRLTDGTAQLVVIDVASGTLTVLRTVDWRGPDRLFLSPDGQYLAYDLRAPDASTQRDIYVIDIGSRREAAAVQHSASDGLLGWSPDGRFLLFSSDRGGANGIYAQPVSQGRPSGPPEIVKSDGAGLSLGFSRAGTLFVYKTVSSRDVQVAAFDASSGTIGDAQAFRQGFVIRPRVPDWSPDGRLLAYPGCADGDCIVIRDVENGSSRLLQGNLLFVRDPRWSPDGRAILVASRDRQGRNGIFRVDATSGSVASVVLGPGFRATPVWSPDGSRIYYLHEGVIERTLASGAERKLFASTGRGSLEISPDGRWLALISEVGDQNPRRADLVLIPTTGGEARALLSVSEPETFGPPRTLVWTPDSRAVLVMRVGPEAWTLWRVPVEGGASARKLDVDATRFTTAAEGMLDQGFAVSRDGRRIAFLAGRTASEVWAVEDVVSSLRARN